MPTFDPHDAKDAERIKRTIMAIHCFIPAHNEQSQIADSIASLQTQSLKPDFITVIADNCSDNTVEISQDGGAEVFVSVDNDAKKAGALNQVLDQVLPDLDDEDIILIMDADTVLGPAFVKTAVDTFAANSSAGVCSATFFARPPQGILELCQANEYARYARSLARRGYRPYVASGTASAFRAKALKQVKSERGAKLPYHGGGVYDTHSLTEDNEITLALLCLGWELTSVRTADASSTTDVMPTAKMLYRQRLRWYLGAIVNLFSYGTKLPRKYRYVYWGQQIGLFASLLGTILYLTYLIWSVLIGASLTLDSPWSAVLGITLVERTVSVWRFSNWKGRLLALTILPEMVYALGLLGIYGVAVSKYPFNKKGSW